VPDLSRIAHEAVRTYGAAQQPPELSGLLALVPSGGVVVEVGCDAGGVLWAFQQAGAGHVIGVDLPRGPYSSGRKLAAHGAEMVIGNSREQSTRRRLVEVLDGDPVDLLFLDADHTYKGVKADWETYGPLVRPGGVVTFHDICHHKDYPEVQVERLWWELKSKNPDLWSEIVYYARPWGSGMGIGVLRRG
jgi:predicted O-methyltransferase YrrM